MPSGRSIPVGLDHGPSILLSGIEYHSRHGELGADASDGGTRVRRDRCSTPATQAAQAGQRWLNGTPPVCSWQAVVLKASILQLPGKPDCLDWSWLQIR